MVRSPVAYALLIALSYASVAGVYISLSGEFVASRTLDVETLHRLEVAKGFGFVVVTGCALFAACLLFFKRFAEQTRRLERSQRALIEAEHRALPGLLAASIAHDFNNLLMILRCALEVFDPHLSDGDARLSLDDARGAVDRAEHLAQRLSQSGRSTAMQGTTPQAVDLAALAVSVVELLKHHPAARHRQLSARVEPAVLNRSHAGLLHQLITNLTLNALQATRAGGRVEVRIGREGDPAGGGNGDACVLEVHDDGSGISAERKLQLAEPYFTTKSSGTGLGLLSARMCAEVHGARIEIMDSEFGGALFRVRLGQQGVTDPLARPGGPQTSGSWDVPGPLRERPA